MTQTLRILHILRAPVGGLFRHVRDIALEQIKWGLDVGVLCDANSYSGSAEQSLAELGSCLPLGLHLTPMGRAPGFADIRAISETRCLTRELDIDVLHSHGAKGGLVARLGGSLPAGRAGLRPLRFYTPHGGSLHYFDGSVKGNVVVSVEAALARLTDGLIFESAFGRDRYASSISLKSVPNRVIANGLAEPDFARRELREDAVEFLFIGELRHLKGVDVLLAALKRLNAATARAVIVGDGPEVVEFKAMVHRLGLGARVSFVGALPASIAFTMGKILVMPSRAENLPYVAMEAAAAGVPLIATQVGGLPEIIQGSDTRLVPADDPEALACAMALVADDFEAAGKRAERLRSIVKERFTTTRMVRSTLEFYRDALLRISAERAPAATKPSEIYCNRENP